MITRNGFAFIIHDIDGSGLYMTSGDSWASFVWAAQEMNASRVAILFGKWPILNLHGTKYFLLPIAEFVGDRKHGSSPTGFCC